LAQSHGDFILEVIRIDLHYHRGHSRPARSFRHKIDCSAETVRDTAKVIIKIIFISSAALSKIRRAEVTIEH